MKDKEWYRRQKVSVNDDPAEKKSTGANFDGGKRISEKLFPNLWKMGGEDQGGAKILELREKKEFPDQQMALKSREAGLDNLIVKGKIFRH